MHLPTPAPTALPNSSFSPDDLAFIAALEASIGELNAAMDAGQFNVGELPAVPPTSTDSQGYWIVEADDTLDSDRDGTADYLEFENALNPAHPNQSLGQAFSSDADGDGQPDGDQTDSDQDGLIDRLDAYDGDPAYDYEAIGVNLSVKSWQRVS